MKIKFSLDVPKANNQRLGVELQGKFDFEAECSLEELIDMNKNFPEQIKALKEFIKEL